jgi:hypothetical protein
MRVVMCAVLACCSLAVIGCHDYRPLAGTTPAENAFVRVNLNDSGSTLLSGYLGPRIVAVDGRYSHGDGDGFELFVSSTEDVNGMQSYWHGERVTIPRSAIATVQARKLAPFRTALLSGGIGAAIAGVVSAFTGHGVFGIGGSSGGRPGPK